MTNATEFIKSFRNIRNVGKHLIYDHYIVSGEPGDIAEILIFEKEVNVIVDNFPFQRKSFKYNFPIESAEQFRRDMIRIGLDLKWKHTLCDFCNEIKDCEGGIVCTDCEKHK